MYIRNTLIYVLDDYINAARVLELNDITKSTDASVIIIGYISLYILQIRSCKYAAMATGR